MTVSSVIADTKDTADDVMKAGKQTGANVGKLLADLRQRSATADTKTKPDLENEIKLLNRLQTLFGRMGQDRAYATQILNLSLKKDKQGLGNLWQRDTHWENHHHSTRESEEIARAFGELAGR